MHQEADEQVKRELFDLIEKCLLGCVASQDIRVSLNGFEKLISRFGSTKHDEKSMIFRSSVISYCKPFLVFKASKDGRTRQYPIKKMRKSKYFDQKIHDHLIDVRNKIIAHSDWTELKPQFTMISFRPHGLDWEIPMQISVTSQALTFPISVEFVIDLRNHVAASLRVIEEALEQDLMHLRHFYVKFPELCRSFLSNLAEFDVEVKENLVKIPEIENEIPEIEEPDYSSVHSGYHYETQNFTFKYAVEETFTLATGEKITVAPDTWSSDSEA